ncbi:MAG: stress response translation initiation inhibitor YciH [Candidatus Micrarchaeaceae archaeon]
MVEICPKCGLPKDICVCDVLDKETENNIKVYTKKAKFDKIITVIEGVPQNDIESTSKNLKRALGCGGTYEGSIIELQGNHKLEAKKALVGLGYNEQNIEVM